MKRVIGLLTLIFTLCLFLPTMAAAADELPDGFIALAPNEMNWSDAVAWCKEQGGKLPRIDNIDAWDGKGEVIIDGFGAHGAPWPSGLPKGLYWTGVMRGSCSTAWAVSGYNGGKVGIAYYSLIAGNSVVCVP